jgi:hypothetical protein
VQPQPRRILTQMGFGRTRDGLRFAENLDEAIRLVSSGEMDATKPAKDAL